LREPPRRRRDGLLARRYSINKQECAINKVALALRRAVRKATARLNVMVLASEDRGPIYFVDAGRDAILGAHSGRFTALEAHGLVERVCGSATCHHPGLAWMCQASKVTLDAAVAQGVAAIMGAHGMKVPDALAQATTAGVQEPPEGFERKIVSGHLKLVARDGAVASRADDAYAAAASLEADTSLTPTAALDAVRAARLRLEGLRYEPRSNGHARWFLDGAPEPITRVNYAEALSARLVDEVLVGLRYDADERVKVAFDETVREHYAVKGLDYEWISGMSTRGYFIEGCLASCWPFRIRSIEDARECSRELGDGGLIGRGLDDLDVRRTFFKYATDWSGRSQAERDALPTPTHNFAGGWVSVVPEDFETLGSPADLRWAAERTDDMPENRPVGISLTSGPSSNWRVFIARTHLGCYPSAAQAWAAYPKATADDDSESDNNSITLDQMRENAMLPPAKRHRS